MYKAGSIKVKFPFPRSKGNTQRESCVKMQAISSMPCKTSRWSWPCLTLYKCLPQPLGAEDWATLYLQWCLDRERERVCEPCRASHSPTLKAPTPLYYKRSQRYMRKRSTLFCFCFQFFIDTLWISHHDPSPTHLWVPPYLPSTLAPSPPKENKNNKNHKNLKKNLTIEAVVCHSMSPSIPK